MMNEIRRNAQSTSNIIVLALAFIFLSGVLSDMISADTEPFTITEKTIYGFTENIVYVTVTENTGKDQIINISNIFTQHPLTEEIKYEEILILQEHSVDIYGLINEYQGKYKTVVTDSWYETIIEYNEITGLNESIEVLHTKTMYYDAFGIEMFCDYVLEDKSCLIESMGVTGTKLQNDFLPLPNIKEKMVIGDLKIEQKQEGIPLPKNGAVFLRYSVKHPIPYKNMPQIANKYNITVCSYDGTECTTLDPTWWNNSWNCRKEIQIDGTGREIIANYQLLINVSHVTGKMNITFQDIQFTDLSNNELAYWVEKNVSSDYAEVWVKVNISNSTNTTIYMYYSNDDATTTSNGTATFLDFDDFNTDLSKWTIELGTPTLETSTYISPPSSVYLDSNDQMWKYLDEDYTRNITIEIQGRYTSATANKKGYLMLPYGSDTGLYTLTGFISDKFQYFDSSYHTIYDTEINTWYRVKMDLKIPHDTVDFYVDDMDTPKITDALTYTQSDKVGRVFIYDNAGDPNPFYADNYFVREHAGIEPPYSFSAEQTINTAPTTPDIAPQTNSNISVDYQVITCENSTDADLDTIYYLYYGDTNENPVTLLQNTTLTTYNWTSLSQGLNYFKCQATDNIDASANTSVYNVNVDTLAPTVDAYYQWDSTNDTVNFGIWTEGFVSINWNLTDYIGINTSTCSIKVRNKNYVTNHTNYSYINDTIHPDYDHATGYKDLTCYTEDLGNGTIKVSANMTRSYDWRPLITAFDQDNASHDNIFYTHGGRSTKITFHNITDTINTTFVFLADVVNQTDTVADVLFYSCNETYVSGDFTTDPNCAFVGASHPDASRDVNFNYLLGALTTDENGTFGGVVHTETMYGMSYCPSCTNENNAWITYSTNGYDGHSATSINHGIHWTDLTGEEFNVILHVINNLRLEFNMTIDDNLGTQLSDLQTDDYGALPNEEPYGDILEDNVTGGLVSYYDIHGVSETGTIWFNVSVYDPNADSTNCTLYLLNNDSSLNQTLLENHSIDGYGICPYEWNTTTIPDGDYRLNATATDGLLTGHDESAGYIRIDNTVPTITIQLPENISYDALSVDLNVSADESIDEWYYSIDYSEWTLFTPNTTLIGFEYNGVYLLEVLAFDFAGLNDTDAVYFSINYTGGSIPRELNCSSSDTHYISVNPLDDDDLRWSCELDVDVPYYCVTHVFGNDEFNQKDEDKLLQTNPKRKVIKRYGIVDYFKSTGSYANVYFTDEKLMAESNYTYEVECISASGLYSGFFSKSVGVEYLDMPNSMAFGVWGINNTGYLFGIFFMILFLVIILSWGLGRR